MWPFQYPCHFLCNFEQCPTCHASREHVLLHMAFLEILSICLYICYQYLVYLPKHFLECCSRVYISVAGICSKGGNLAPLLFGE